MTYLGVVNTFQKKIQIRFILKWIITKKYLPNFKLNAHFNTFTETVDSYTRIVTRIMESASFVACFS